MSVSDLKDSQNIFQTKYGEWLPVKVVGYALVGMTLILCVNIILPTKFIFLEILNRRKSKKRVWNLLGAFTVCLVVFGFTGLTASLSNVITLITSSLYPVVSKLSSGLVPATRSAVSERKEEGERSEVEGRPGVGSLAGCVLSVLHWSRSLLCSEVTDSVTELIINQ